MEIKRIITGCSVLICFVLSSCALRVDLAPVEEAFWREQSKDIIKNNLKKPTQQPNTYKQEQKPRKVEQKTEKIIKSSNIQNKLVQEKRFTAQNNEKKLLPANDINKKQSVVNNKIKNNSAKSSNEKKSSSSQIKENKEWRWPTVSHKVIVSFAPLKGKKGINLKGKKGDKIYATRDGIVQYAGNGLQSYGNLIIIKHNNQYLTAYGNNLHNLVKEGDRVKAGQVIAEMGVIERKYWGLHFEIRKAGKPLNPLDFLAAVNLKTT